MINQQASQEMKSSIDVKILVNTFIEKCKNAYSLDEGTDKKLRIVPT